MRYADASPRDVVLEMLRWRFGAATGDATLLERAPAAFPAPTSQAAAALLPFQRDAVQRLDAILRRRGGAIHADSVGLGKTHVAVALIRERVQRAPVLVTAPAPLAVHWRRHLRGVRGWDWLSHTSLSRGQRPARMRSTIGHSGPNAARGFHDGVGASAARTSGPHPLRGLIVVDEAHAFRNPAARRHRVLAELCARADVLLITATPVNNSAHDFLHLLRLFARDDAFADIGVPDLHAAFDALVRRGDDAAVRRVAEVVMVRRTRAIAHGAAVGDTGAHPVSAPELAGPTLTFPRVRPIVRLRYDIDASRDVALREVLRIVARLQFPVHALRQRTGATELLRMSLLKRLESSTAAFAASVERHASLLLQFTDAARTGFLLEPRDAHRPDTRTPGAVQLVLRGVALRAWPLELDREEALRQARAELRRVRRLRDLARRLGGTADVEAVDTGAAAPTKGRAASLHGTSKVEALARLLAGALRDDAVLVFTEYRDTAVHLWRRLGGMGGVALIHGREARLGRGIASRSAVIRRFAPRSNGARPPPPRERVRVLIATDVLAEGLNLQDARAVVSYDLPWNPVRIAQRIGRIDRLGSPHAEVAAYAFVPDRGLDALLGLIRRLRRKLRQIRAVGGDRPRFGGRAALEDDSAERLRAVWRAQTPPDAPAGSAPPAATTSWNGDGRAAICCLTRGTTCWTVLVQEHPPQVRTAAAADSALLQVLAQSAAAHPPGGTPSRDAAWRARALRIARTAVRAREIVAPANASHRTRRRAASLIHRWLATRPGGPATADCDHADRLLARLAGGLTAALQRRLDAAVAGRQGDPDAAMRALAAVLEVERDGRGAAGRENAASAAGAGAPTCSGSDTDTRRPPAHDERAPAHVTAARPRLRVRAMLELVPAPPPRPAPAQGQVQPPKVASRPPDRRSEPG